MYCSHDPSSELLISWDMSSPGRWEARDKAVSFSQMTSSCPAPCRVSTESALMKTRKLGWDKAKEMPINMAQNRLWGEITLSPISLALLKSRGGRAHLTGRAWNTWCVSAAPQRTREFLLSLVDSWEWSSPLPTMTFIIWEFHNQSKISRCWIAKINDKHPLCFLLFPWMGKPKAKTRVRS